MSYFRVNERCNGCLACVENCPARALNYRDEEDRRIIYHNMTLCARCGQCWRICPQNAIEFKELLYGQWDEVVSLELIRCEVCGEVVYTENYRKNLEDKTKEKPLPLCVKHKQKVSLRAWPKLVPGKEVPKEV